MTLQKRGKQMKRGMNSSEMQKNNRILVFKTLLENGSMMRTELASGLGLQKATITNIVNEFLEMGIIVADAGSVTGRRGEYICLKLDRVYIMSMSITRKDYQIDIFSLEGNLIDHETYDFDSDEDIHNVIDRLKKHVGEKAEKFGKDRLIGICLAVPGLFIKRKHDENEMFRITKFEQLSQVNIRAELEEVLGVPVLMKHDAKLAAYAEWHNAQEVQEDRNVSLIVIRSKGFGIGAGIVINGRIVEGHMGIAGEIGHMGINYNGKQTLDMPRGTLEYCAGTESAVRYMLDRLCEFPDSILNEESNYQDIVLAYQQGDELAVWAVEKMAWMLGYGIANIVYTINPDCIILGQEYPAEDSFIQKVNQSVKQFVHPFVGEEIEVRYSKLSKDSFLLGGYYYVLEQLYKENTILDKVKEIVQLLEK